MTDLAELFARDPLSLTKEDVSSVVTEYRARRGQFTLGAMKAGKVAKPTKKAAAVSGLDLKLDLSAVLGGKK